MDGLGMDEKLQWNCGGLRIQIMGHGSNLSLVSWVIHKKTLQTFDFGKFPEIVETVCQQLFSQFLRCSLHCLDYDQQYYNFTSGLKW